jgi:hypothetical protein
VLPELRFFAPYIKRIRVDDTEIELTEQIKEQIKWNGTLANPWLRCCGRDEPLHSRTEEISHVR